MSRYLSNLVKLVKKSDISSSHCTLNPLGCTSSKKASLVLSEEQRPSADGGGEHDDDEVKRRRHFATSVEQNKFTRREGAGRRLRVASYSEQRTDKR